MSRIIDLQEISPNNWKANYQGNYGTYTIKIETDGKKTTHFSCSCPSDYYPCKHIPMIQEAISERMARNENNNDSMLLENAIRNIPLKDLQDFIIRYARYNSAMMQAILLEFTPQQEQSEGNDNYRQIIRSGLKDTYFDYDDVYEYDYCLEIDVLDQWINKAEEYANRGNYTEAVLIAKACIEEYAAWIDDNADCGYIDYINENYDHELFDILRTANEHGHLNAEELLSYCRDEKQKKEYKGNSLYDSFEELEMEMLEETDPAAYLTMQDDLFKQVSDKSSYQAKEILKRKISFYKNHEQPEKAYEIVKDNMQIEDFRKEVVQKLIAENEFNEAKKLINDFIDAKKSDGFRGYFPDWDEFLLNIAQKENDVLAIRKISKRFIENSFKLDYYNLYKSTFSPEEWPAEMEKLIKDYQKSDGRWFVSDIADIFVTEKLTERLIDYLEHYLGINAMEKYYKYVASVFPEKTTTLFRQAIDRYVEKNTGRDIYEKAVQLMDCMLKIDNGKKVVSEMVDQYKIIYKNRRAMIEILNRFSNEKMQS